MMHVFVSLFGSLSLLALLIGQVWLIVSAFSEGAVWGLICLFVPGGAFGYVFRNWDTARRPFFLWLAGLGGVVITLGAMSSLRDAEHGFNAPLPRGVTSPRPPRPKDYEQGEVPPSAAPKTACPKVDIPSQGFALWCCNEDGWQSAGKSSDCTSVSKPSDPCEPPSYGRTAQTVCSSLGRKRR